jgi:hypothetical protein
MTSILSLSEAVAELIHDGDQVACEGFTFFGISRRARSSKSTAVDSVKNRAT